MNAAFDYFDRQWAANRKMWLKRMLNQEARPNIPSDVFNRISNRTAYAKRATTPSRVAASATQTQPMKLRGRIRHQIIDSQVPTELRKTA